MQKEFDIWKRWLAKHTRSGAYDKEQGRKRKSPSENKTKKDKVEIQPSDMPYGC